VHKTLSEQFLIAWASFDTWSLDWVPDTPVTASRLHGISPVGQTDPGSSGGPLAGLEGQVVGVNTEIATVVGPEAGSIGIGFAVPIDRAAYGRAPDHRERLTRRAGVPGQPFSIVTWNPSG
jgi:hypothetical protein